MAGQRRVVVLGGGISGLTFSYYLNVFKKSVLTLAGATLPQVTLLEKSPKVGGWMNSYQDHSTGAVFEYGPRSLRAVGHEAKSSMALAEELGLSEKIIAVRRSSPAGKQRLIYSGEKLHPLPTGVFGFVKKLSLINKSLASVAYKEYRLSGSEAHRNKDESVHSFVSRRCGSEVADYLADPFLRGIIAGDSKHTSIISMFPRLKVIENQYGSIIKNFSKVPEEVKGVVQESAVCRKAKDEKWVMWSFESGLGTLPCSLHKAIVDQGSEVKTNTACTKIEKHGKGFLVHTDTGEVLEADLVVAAINAKTLGKLLADKDHTLSKQLSTLPIHDVATATLEYPSHALPNLTQAFGHLVPSCEQEENLGVIYDSMVFPQHDRTDKSTKRFTVMIGGAWFTEVLGANPSVSTVEEIAMRSIAKQLNISGQPVNIRTNIIKDAIPQYPVGHTQTVADIDEYIVQNNLPLCIMGPSYDRPGVNSCIHRAKVQAMSILDLWDTMDFQSKYDKAKEQKLQ